MHYVSLSLGTSDVNLFVTAMVSCGSVNSAGHLLLMARTKEFAIFWKIRAESALPNGNRVSMNRNPKSS